MYTNIKKETQFVVTKMARVFCFLLLAEFHAKPIVAVRIKTSFNNSLVDLIIT